MKDSPIDLKIFHLQAYHNRAHNPQWRTMPKPKGYEAWAATQPAPFVPAPLILRPAVLSAEEVARLYDAVAFAMWAYGLPMNVHLTFNWGMMGLKPDAACRVLGQYHGRAAKWLAARKERDVVRRIRVGYGLGTDYVCVHVHENTGKQGFHTHVMTYVHEFLQQKFEMWSRKSLARLAGRSSIPEDALHLTTYSSRHELQAVEQCWRLFSYVAKQLGEDFVIDKAGKLHPSREVFRVQPARTLRPLAVPQMIKIGHNVGETAQRALGFKSRFRLGEWFTMYWANVMDEYRERMKAEAHRIELYQLLQTIQP